MSIGETIPIRLFLGGFDLTPTFREVNKKFSTRYYLSLVLIDEGMQYVFVSMEKQRLQEMLTFLIDARRYFKQSEIVLYRQQPEIAPGAPQQPQIVGAPPPERVDESMT